MAGTMARAMRRQTALADLYDALGAWLAVQGVDVAQLGPFPTVDRLSDPLMVQAELCEWAAAAVRRLTEAGSAPRSSRTAAKGSR